MAAEAPFSLSRVTADDMPELLDVQYEAFPDFVRIIFMGCHSKDDLPKLIPKYIQKMQSDPSDVWVKVTDNETGKIIAASNWKVFPGEPSDNHADEPPDWLESEEKEKSRKVIEEMTEIRKKAMPGPYVRMLTSLLSLSLYNVLITCYASRPAHPVHRRRVPPPRRRPHNDAVGLRPHGPALRAGLHRGV